jgi:hypothetical protein
VLYSRARIIWNFRIAVCVVLSVGFMAAATGCGVHVNNLTALTGASIQVSPGNVSFGTVKVGQTASTAITVANNGDQTLTVSQLQIPGQIFWVSSAANPPVQIPAGESYKFSLDFKPTSATAYSGQLTILNTAATTPAVTVPVSGSGSSTPTSTPRPTTSELTLSASSVAFGNVATGSSATKTLTLTSSGTAPLNVSSIEISGGAYSVTGASLPLTLNPNQQVALQVKFAPKAAGTSVGQVTIQSDATNSPTATVSLNGAGASAAATTPALTISAASLNFGNVTVGSASTQTLRFSSTGTAAVTISSLTLTGGDYFVSGALFPLTINAGQSSSLQVQFKPADAGVATGQIAVKSNSATTPNAVIALTGTGSSVATTPGLSLSAASLSFGSVTVGSASAQTLRLSSTGTASVTIESVGLSGAAYSMSGATFPLTIAPGTTSSLQVQFKPTAAGAASGQLTVRSNSANTPNAVVALSGTGSSVATTPGLSLSAASLSFGSVNVGSASAQTLRLSSTGTASVTIESVGLSGAAYSMSGATFPLTIAPGTTSSLQVQFKPTAAGAASGQLTVRSNSANTPNAVVALSGTGTSVPTTPQLTISAASLSFGSVNVGGSVVQTLKLSSTGSGAVTVNSVAVSGTGYSISGATFPVTIAPNLQVSLQVLFKPTAAGTVAGQLTVKSTSTANPTASVALSGSGVASTPQLSISATSLNFGNVVVNASAAQTLVLTSSGTAPVTVSSVSLSGVRYSLSGASFPVSLAAGQSAALQVLFKPTAAGAATGLITIISNSSTNPTATVALSGNGSTTSNPSGTPTGTPLSACGDLTASGTYYLSQDVTSPGTCFFIDASNITLNLNGHTITYGTGGGSAGTPGVLLADTWYTGGSMFSIAKTGSVNAHGGFEIYNGTIQSSQAAAPQSRGIWVGQSSYISPAPKVHDLTINTTAVDANPIFGDSSLSGWQIYNNNLSYGATGSGAITNRYTLLGYAIWMADTLNAPGAIPDEIYSNHILAAPQGGIYDTNQNNHVHDNSITFNSYFTNDYCVAAVSGNGAIVSNNSCTPTSGRGYDIEASNVTLSNNTATVTERSQNAEYGGCELGGADGIRLKDNYNTPAGGAPAPPSGAIVTGNVINATATVCQANALRLSFLYPGDTATISGNTFTSTGAGSTDFAISFDQVTAAPLNFSNNTFSARLAHIQIDYDGVTAGLIQAGQTWAGSPTYSIYDVDGGGDRTNSTHPGLSTLIVEDDILCGLLSKKYCGPVSLSALLLGGLSLTCP